jgi:hypothetical protein
MIELIESEFVELLAGRRPEIEVGTLPYEVRKYFECSRDTVFLTTFSARHIIQQHGDHIGFAQAVVIPSALTKGLWIGDRPDSCVVSFLESGSGQRYIGAIKVTKDRTRSYLTTFHFASIRQTKSLLKRGQPLRDHW